MAKIQALVRKIEERYGMELPDAYVDLMNRGWLQWSEAKRPFRNVSSESPMFYLWFSEMEWLQLPEIEAFTHPKYAMDRFVPFAHDGGGAKWSWDPKRKDKSGVSVVYLPNDCEIAYVYAPNFISALYRHALDFARYCHGEDETRTWLALWCHCFTPYLPKQWINRLKKVQSAPYINCKEREGWGSLLSDRTLRNILRTDLELPEKDIEFKWLKPRSQWKD